MEDSKIKYWDSDVVPMEFYPESYKVSRDGHIFRRDKTMAMWVTCETFRFKDGVSVKVDRNWWSLDYHVARHFVPNPLGLGEVGHKDGDIFNNHSDNLFWTDGNASGTYREGMCEFCYCLDCKQRHWEMMEKGERSIIIMPKDYEFAPELGLWMRVRITNQSLKFGLKKLKPKHVGWCGSILFTFKEEKKYGEISEEEWLKSGLKTGYTGDNRYYASNTGRYFYEEEALKNASDNLMMSMYGKVPVEVVMYKFTYKSKRHEV